MNWSINGPAMLLFFSRHQPYPTDIPADIKSSKGSSRSLAFIFVNTQARNMCHVITFSSGNMSSLVANPSGSHFSFSTPRLTALRLKV